MPGTRNRLISTLLCFSIILAAIPIQMVLSANDSIDYVVWEANADTVQTEFDKKINASNDLDSPQEIYRGYENGGGYYRTEFSIADKGSDQAMVCAKTNISSSLSGFGWMGNKSVLNKIKPYLQISFQYRLSSDKEIPADAKLCVFAANQSNKQVSKLITVSVSKSEQWAEVSFRGIENDFSTNWKEGYFSIGLYSDTENFSGHQILDLKGLRLIINSNDRHEINTAIGSVSKVNNIENFTLGVVLSKYNGINDYFKIFTNYDKTSRYGTSVKSDYYAINLLEDDFANYAVSRTRAKGRKGDTAGDIIVIYSKVLDRYTVKDVVISKADGTPVEYKQNTKNKQYTFEMPDSDVTISFVTEALDYNRVNLLWQMTVDQEQITPWYNGASWPCSWSTVPLQNTSAYVFKASQENGEVTLFGKANSKATLEDYYETAVISFMIKTDTKEEKGLTLSTAVGGGSKALFVKDEWQYFTIPLKEIASKPGFNYFTLGFNGFKSGESFFVGPIYIWSFDNGKSDIENVNSLYNIDGYEKSLTNELLGVIGYYGLSPNTYGELGTYPHWDAAWYDPFRDETPLTFCPSPEGIEVHPYLRPLYGAGIPTAGNVDVTEYIDTGYLEFYIKSTDDKWVIPFTLESYTPDKGRTRVPCSVMYDASKARDDGYMCVRIPFTYFDSFGLDMTRIGVFALHGNQPLPEMVYISPIRLYSNYAEIDDPIPVEKEKPVEERDIPIEFDSEVINVVFDKENEELLVPEEAYLWEILSAITLDSKDITVEFVENDEILVDENEIITEGMIMRLRRRGRILREFEVYYLLEEQ